MSFVDSTQTVNYVGHLFQKHKRTNAYVKLAGGVMGGTPRLISSTIFESGVSYDLGAPSLPANVEGTLGAPTNTVPTQDPLNVLTQFKDTASLTLTAQAVTGRIDGLAVVPGAGNGALNTEFAQLSKQIDFKIEKLTNQLNLVGLHGIYSATGTRQSRGLATAVTTNRFGNAGTNRAITKAIFENALRDSFKNGSWGQTQDLYAFVSPEMLQSLTTLYYVPNQQPVSVDTFGVAMTKILTAFGYISLVVELDCTINEIFIVNGDSIELVMLPIQGQGVFVDVLGRVADATQAMVMMEACVGYGSEFRHAYIADLTP